MDGGPSDGWTSSERATSRFFKQPRERGFPSLLEQEFPPRHSTDDACVQLDIGRGSAGLMCAGVWRASMDSDNVCNLSERSGMAERVD